MARRRRKGNRQFAIRGTVRLAIVFALLVGINVYVFFFSSRSIKEMKKDLPQRGMAEAQIGGQPDEAAPPVPAAAAEAAPHREPAAAVPGRAVEGTIAGGEGLGAVLLREGLTPPERDELLRVLAPIMDFRKEIRAGQKYVLRYDDQGRLLGFELRATPLTVYQVERAASGALVARKAAGGKTELKIQELDGTISTSLYGAVKDLGEGTELVSTLVDLFAYDLNFYIDQHEGDRFKIIVEKQYLDGKFYKYGKVLAAEYAGKAGTFRAFHWTPPGGQGGYYDGQGLNIAKSMLKTPLKYARVSSGFNPKRMHPVLHVTKGHFGTDYAAPTGTPVWASAGGKVTWVGPRGGAGNCVMIDHGGGLETTYMHLSKFAKGLRNGQRVSAKQVIGYVGATGLATGPHLHFSVKKNGKYVDPMKLKPDRMAPVAAKHKDQFKREIAERVARLEQVTAASAPVSQQ